MRHMVEAVGDPARKPPGWPRWLRGVVSSVGAPLGWGGRFCGSWLASFRTPERYDHGLIIILPGIESQSFLNHSIAWGMADAGWPGAIEIDDWTTTCTLLFVYHLRGQRRNRRQAQRIARRIENYQSQFPGRPVHLIGHSGGGAISVWTLEELKPEKRVTSAFLLAPALSPSYPINRALARTEQGIWNFWSPLDAFFLGVGTCALGTMDGRWGLSGGMIGFRPAPGTTTPPPDPEVRLHQVRYQPQMAAAFNLGGHFGCVNRVFVETWIAPLIISPTTTDASQHCG